MKHAFKQFISFSVVGTLSAVIHFTVLILAVELLGTSPVIASAMGFVTAVVVNYLLNYYCTFRSKNRHIETTTKFLFVTLTGLLLNSLIMYLLTFWLHYFVSQVFAAATVLSWNFICNRYWTFREAHCAE